jgi:hypothetical protein
MTNRNNSSSNLQQQQQQQQCGGSTLNRIFVITCVASALLQLAGSLASWQQHGVSNANPTYAQTATMASFMEPHHAASASRSLQLKPVDSNEGPLDFMSVSSTTGAIDTTGGTKLFPKHKGRVKFKFDASRMGNKVILAQS